MMAQEDLAYVGNAGRGSQGLAQALGTTTPVVKPRLPTGPKPIPAAPVPEPAAAAPIVSEPQDTAEPDIGKIAALRGSKDEQAVLGGLSKATEEQYKASSAAATLAQKAENDKTERAAKAAKDIADKAKVISSQEEAATGKFKEFVPTQSNAKDIGALFSLLTVAAFGAGGQGRYAGMMAMKNMSGALQGYKEGRTDLFNKELKEYDKNFAAMKANNDLAQKTYNRAMELLSLDKEAGLAEMAHLASLDSNGVVAMQVRAHDWEGVGKSLETRAKAIRLSEEKREKLTQDAQIKADALAEKKRHEQMMERLGQQRINVTIAGKDAKASAKGADDVSSYLSDKGIHIADKKDRAAVQSAVNAYSTLQSLKSDVASDPSLVGRQGQIRQFADKYYQSFKGEGPAVDESGVKPEDQAALRFAKKYASMLTRYEQALAGTSRSGSTVAFQKRFNALLSQDQFNPAGLSALMDDMEVEVARGAREKSPKITHGVMEDMASEFGAGLEQPISKAAPAAALPAASSSQKVDIKSYPIIGNTPDGRPVHQAPDGKKYVE
jgi:hypothetical protein